MAVDERDAVRAETPAAQAIEDPKDIRLGEPSHAAGGVPAIVSSLKHAFAEMGPGRSAATLLKVNQEQGFDCPGCAWPDPQGHRRCPFTRSA